MNIRVIGSGMYVTGRNNSGVGTILSSICEYSKKSYIENVTVVSKNEESGSDVKEAEARINTNFLPNYNSI